LVVRCAVFRDLDNPIIASKTASSAFAYGASTFQDTSYTTEMGMMEITGSDCTGYGNDKLNFNSFIKITESGGASEGVMRPIVDYTSTSGRILMTPFKDIPDSGSTFEIIHFGALMTGQYYYQNFNNMWTDVLPCNASSDTVVFMYGDKDHGLFTVTKSGSTYYFSFYGNIDPFNETDTTTTDSDTAQGATTISVVDASIFEADTYYRIISRDVDDWAANRTVQTEVFWIDELPTEVVYVSAVDTDNNNITVSPITYSYKSGAVLGENPRPIFGKINATTSGHSQMMKAEGNTTAPGSLQPCVHVGSDTYGNFYRHVMYVAPSAAIGYWDEALSDAFGVFPVSETYADDNREGRRRAWLCHVGSNRNNATYGYYGRLEGTLPFVWCCGSAPYGGGNEDTVLCKYNGSYETFRVFYEGNSDYYIVGPEST
jgi:hypothetical protein